MAPFEPALVERRARRAYELARLRRAVVAAAPFAIALGLATLHIGSARTGVLAGVALAAIIAGRWRGRSLGRGVQTGAIAGLVPLLCPLVVTALGHHCTGCAPATPMPLCLVACASSGLLAALWTARRGRAVWSSEAAAALGTAALVGAVGCTVAGGFGLLGLAGGMILGGVPVAFVRATR